MSNRIDAVLDHLAEITDARPIDNETLWGLPDEEMADQQDTDVTVEADFRY